MPSTRVGDLDVVWDVAGPTAGTPVLMINGLGAARGSWYLQVPALAGRYRVYTYDNRDVGETGPVPSDSMSPTASRAKRSTPYALVSSPGPVSPTSRLSYV